MQQLEPAALRSLARALLALAQEVADEWAGLDRCPSLTSHRRSHHPSGAPV